MRIPYISVSRKGTYDTCPQHYKFHYHLGVKSTLPEKSYFVLGKVAHKIIEEHTLSEGKKPIDDIMHGVLSGKIPVDGGANLGLKDLNRLRNHVRNYLKLSKKIGFEGVVEWGFEVDMEKPNAINAKGFIDRLIIKDGKASIIDYKTTQVGPWRKDSTSIKKDLQLATYSWVVTNQMGIDAKDISCALYYLEDGELVPVRFTKATIDGAVKELVSTFKAIRDHDPDKVRGNVGDHCNRCPFNNQCPFFRPKDQQVTGTDYLKLRQLGIKKNA